MIFVPAPQYGGLSHTPSHTFRAPILLRFDLCR